MHPVDSPTYDTLFTNYKKRNADFVQKLFYQALLFCCDESELGTQWFQEEEACDSISHQLDSISLILKEEFILKSNLDRHPYPIFSRCNLSLEWKCILVM